MCHDAVYVFFACSVPGYANATEVWYRTWLDPCVFRKIMIAKQGQHNPIGIKERHVRVAGTGGSKSQTLIERTHLGHIDNAKGHKIYAWF